MSVARGALETCAALLREPTELGRGEPRSALESHGPVLLAITIVSAAVFGGVVGTYRGGIQLVYAAVKLPLLWMLPGPATVRGAAMRRRCLLAIGRVQRVCECGCFVAFCSGEIRRLGRTTRRAAGCATGRGAANAVTDTTSLPELWVVIGSVYVVAGAFIALRLSRTGVSRSAPLAALGPSTRMSAASAPSCGRTAWTPSRQFTAWGSGSVAAWRSELRRPRRPLAWWLLMSHLAVGTAAVVALLLTEVLDRDLRWQTASALEAQAQAWALSLGHAVEVSNRPLAVVAAEHEPLLTEARQRTLAALQVVDRDANVVASATPAKDSRLGDAPEVRAALEGEIGTYARPRAPPWTRREVALDGPSRFGDVRLFVAVPVFEHGEVVGAVVVSRTPRAQLQALVQIGSPLVWRVGAIAFFAVLVALTAGHFGGRSFRRLARAARSIAGGAPPQQQLRGLQLSRVAEVGAVAEAAGTMGDRQRRQMDGAQAFA